MLVRRMLAAALALLGFAAAPAAASAALPPIHHVYVIMLENEGAETSFGAGSPAPYLAHTLPKLGAYLPNYYGIGHSSLDNYVALISGQAPNVETQSDCQFFNDFPTSVQATGGQQEGVGCVYPAAVKTLPDQLDAAGLTWKSYNDSMGADPTRESATCGHPALNSQDHTQSATATDQYASRHDPFVYFHSIIDDQKLCDAHVVNLAPLASDLQSVSATANYTFITPSLCNDGHDAPCADGKNPGGLKQIDTFLQKWVPAITGSPAFKNDGGLLVVTFDESETSDSSSCCGEIAGPGSPRPGESGTGGGRVGAVVISPYVRGGTVDRTAYNHYMLLRSFEDLFGLAHLGYAAGPGGQSFGTDLFACEPSAAPVPSHGLLPAGSVINNVRIIGRGASRWVTLGSVGNSTLTMTASAGRRRTRTTTALVPCRTYTEKLPRGHGRVRVSAAVGGASQTQTLKF